jgi:hypothetical protein
VATEKCFTRSDIGAPMVIIDTAEPFMSHADGRMYDSKSTYYRSLKAHGCRIVETGENHGQPVPGQITPPWEDVKNAYCKVRDGYKPAPLQTENQEP